MVASSGSRGTPRICGGSRGHRPCLAVVTGLLIVLLAAPGHVGAEFQAAHPGYAYRFPRDHGSHETFRTEWWYYTGHLAAENGRQFGYELTFFRRGLDDPRVLQNPSRWAIRHVYLAHFALTDVAGNRFLYAEKISRAGIEKAGAEAGRLRVWIDSWAATATPGVPGDQHLTAATNQFALDVTLTPVKPLVIHGRTGVSLKGTAPGEASHYYSFSRLRSEGTLTLGAEQIHVRGTSWMDHEFGSGDLAQDLVGWDWFSVQLDDETELMLYRLRRADGTVSPVSSGTFVRRDGTARHLEANEARIEVLDHWSSPGSGARYPARWRITIPSLALSLTLTPLLANQELITSRSTRITYWEGAAAVVGRREDQTVEGRAYVELTGYAEPYRPQR